MNLMQLLIHDKEIQHLKRTYKEIFNKNAPPYTIGKHNGIEDYRQHLKSLIPQNIQHK